MRTCSITGGRNGITVVAVESQGVALWKRKQRKRKQYPYRRRNDRAGHDSVHERKQL